MRGNFSTYPWERLRKLSRHQAQLESTVARWIAATPRGLRLGKLLGAGGVKGAAAGDKALAGGVDVEIVAPSAAFDPHAARCEVRVGGATFDVRGSSRAVRAIAQRLLGGPEELAAARPLTIVERSIWALVVATAVEDLGVLAEVWPVLVDTKPVDAKLVAANALAATVLAAHGDDIATRVEPIAGRADPSKPRAPARASSVELAVTLGDIAIAVQILAPADLELRALPARRWPAWFDATMIDVPIVVGRCALVKADLDRLAPRNVITLDRPHGDAELELLGGVIGLRAGQGNPGQGKPAEPASAVVAEVATGYVPRDMSLPDDAHVELTVALGTTQLSLRQISELAVGQVVQLGRPLAGPFELRAAGRVLGRGELVDVDGELAVRIVSLGDQEL